MSITEKMKTIAKNNATIVENDKTLVTETEAEIFYEAGKNAERDAFWNMFQDNGKRDIYGSAFTNWTAEYIRPLYKVVPTDAQGAQQMFKNASRIRKIEKAYFDVSQKQQGENNNCGYYYMFSGCNRLEEIEDIGLQAEPTTNHNGYMQVFAYCASLHTIAVIRVNENTTFSNTFTRCNSLQNIGIEGVIGKTFDVKSAPLTAESAKNIITHLKNYKGTDNEFKYSVYFAESVWTLLNVEGDASPNGNAWRTYVTEDLCWNI